jgi:4'-phosphopantetheinyl transferase
MIEVDAPTIRPWAPGPQAVRARAGAIDVWRADLAAVGDELEELLCAEERERAARIAQEHDRVRWARSRGVLRALLGRYLDRDPRTLDFVFGPHGKPALPRHGTGSETSTAAEGPGGVGAGRDLRFNLSHSGTLALYAITAGREVGVDIERARERYTPEFLRAWVAREAVGKCRGTGLNRGTGLAMPAQATPQQGSSAGDLWTAELDVGPRAAGAVAVEGGQCELCCWEWQHIHDLPDGISMTSPPQAATRRQ